MRINVRIESKQLLRLTCGPWFALGSLCQESDCTLAHLVECHVLLCGTGEVCAEKGHDKLREVLLEDDTTYDRVWLKEHFVERFNGALLVIITHRGVASIGHWYTALSEDF